MSNTFPNINDLDYNNMYEEDFERKKKVVEDGLWVKLEQTGKKISFARDVIALFRYLRDPYVRWYRKTIVVAALLYFISPVDAIPDLTPFLGYLDDLGVITATLKFLGRELIPYYDIDYRR